MGLEPAEVVHAVLSDLLPLEEGFTKLRLRPAPEEPPPGASPPLAAAGGVTRDAWGVFAALEFTVPWRDHPARTPHRRTMSDTIGLVPAAAFSDMPRVEAYLRGWARAVQRVLRAITETSPQGILLFRMAIPTVLELQIGASVERFERALLAPIRLGKFIPPDPELLSQDAIDWAYHTLEKCLPPSDGRFSLRLAEPLDPVSTLLPSHGGVYGVPEGLRASLALSSYHRPGGSVSDVKQQDIFLVPLNSLRDPIRLEACMRAWGEALEQLFRTSDPEALECLMPHDLSFERVLSQRRLTTREEFREALLGHWNRSWTLR